MTSVSRIWALSTSLLALGVSGCMQPRDPHVRLASRAEEAVTKLEKLQPRLAKTGTPDAEALAEQLAAVRTGLAALPTEAPTPAPAEKPAPPPAALVRCPDDGCWRLGAQAEAAMWRLALRGGGGEITDSGPIAYGLAVGAERALPIDHLLEWSWGAEAVAAQQLRSGGQHVTLIGLRPVVRTSFAVHDAIALTVRPIIEGGQAYARLGAPPFAVLDRTDLYGSLGLRTGMRVMLAAGGELTAEVGWRRIWFQGSAGTTDYRVDIESSEAALGWSRRF